MPISGPATLTDATPFARRPDEGWLKSTRLRRGLSLRAVAERLKVSPQAVHQFEKSEVAGTLSLRQLENVARAMGYRVVYAVRSAETPRQNRPPATEAAANGTLPAPSTPTGRDNPAAAPTPVEHAMFLENQASDRFD